MLYCSDSFGLTQRAYSSILASEDLDKDGDIKIVVSMTSDGEMQIYKYKGDKPLNAIIIKKTPIVFYMDALTAMTLIGYQLEIDKEGNIIVLKPDRSVYVASIHVEGTPEDMAPYLNACLPPPKSDN